MPQVAAGITPIVRVEWLALVVGRNGVLTDPAIDARGAANEAGNLYIVEDNNSRGDIWVATPDRNADGRADAVVLFGTLTTPGAEASGAYFPRSMPDTLLLNIQHPSDGNDMTLLIRRDRSPGFLACGCSRIPLQPWRLQAALNRSTLSADCSLFFSHSPTSLPSRRPSSCCSFALSTSSLWSSCSKITCRALSS